MQERKLDKMFNPETIALIGASEKEGSVGLTLMKNLIDRKDSKLFPVNPNREKVLDIEAYPSVLKIEDPIDLGIIATPASTVPSIVEECGEKGVPALIIISAGFREVGPEGEKLEEELEKVREKYGIRILGPNCLGIIRPSVNLNASITDQMPKSGSIAFISQSGAIASATLDWGIEAQFGFSNFVSVGNMMDVDFGDLIDYFGTDARTKSILLYIEAVKDARKFMSAARGFARTKPIMAMKSGRYQESVKAVVSHTGSMAGEDKVYDAALKRAGITRVNSIEDLFAASETLAKYSLPHGSDLAIITNAGGAGIMATDALIEHGGSLAKLSDSTLKKLEKNLPPRASLLNPIDVTGDANAKEYKMPIELCLTDKKVDGILCIYAPQGQLSPEEAAKAVITIREGLQKPVLTCWMGGMKASEGREILRKYGFSVQNSPEQSVKSFMYLNRYARNLERLLETPEELAVDRLPPKYHLKAMLRRLVKEGREILTEEESKKIIDTYGIPSPPTHVASSITEAKRVAIEIGYPVVMKINSPDVTHKKRAGGVALNIISESDLEKRYSEIMENVKKYKPDAEILGVTVQKMINEVDVELILGCKKDPAFGATILFGRGGSGVEYIEDTEVGLPPLNQNLARMLMEDTKVYNQLRENPNIVDQVDETLVELSQLIIDFPEIEELDINPLAVIGEEIMALDARVIIDKDLVLSEPPPNEHLVIEPYPRKYVEQWRLDDGRPVTLRPIRPEDEPLEFELFDTFSERTWRYRFFGPIREVSHEDMVRYTNIDYRREMAMIGILTEEGKDKMIGVGRLIIEPNGTTGEFAVVVGDPWQGQGLGEKLTDAMIGVAEDKELVTIYGIIAKDNYRMLGLCKKLGFTIEKEGPDTMRATLRLR
jgi:acetyltransferase